MYLDMNFKDEENEHMAKLEAEGEGSMMALSSCQSQQQRGYDSPKAAGYEQSSADSPKPPPEPGESITKGEKGDTKGEIG
eukprot:10338349-Alexandrium_andersonii.AAC.1